MLRVVAILVLAVLALAGAAFFFWPRPAAVPPPPPPEVKLPATCHRGEKLTIVGTTFEGAGTIVTAEGGCRLEIKDSRLTGDVAVRVNSGAHVRIDEGTLTGRDAALVIDGDADVTLRRSTLSGKQSAIRAGSNVTLRADDTRAKGEETAVSAGSNLELVATSLTLEGTRAALEAKASLTAELEKSTLSAQEVALDAGLTSRLRLTDHTTVSAKGTAVRADANLEAEVAASTIRGGDVGVDVEFAAKLRLASGARVEGERMAVRAAGNLDLSLEGATVQAEQTAVCATFGARVSARDSTIAAKEALRFQARPTALSVGGAKVEGDQRFDADGCGTSALAADGKSDFPNIADPRTASSAGPGGAPGVPFDWVTAKRELDRAAALANGTCHRDPGRKGNKAVIDTDFAPDGTIIPKVRNTDEIGQASGCVLMLFKRIRVPPFDPSKGPSGLFRVVGLR